MSPSPQDADPPVEVAAPTETAPATGERQQTSVDNPINGAITFGLGAPLTVAIGAAIRGNNIHQEAITVLYGGLVIGFICGMFGACIIGQKNEQFYNVVLQWCGILLTPLLGRVMSGFASATWSRVIVDGMVGSCVIVGGFCALGCCCLFSCLLCNGGDTTNSMVPSSLSNMMSSRVPAEEPEFAPLPTNNGPAADIEMASVSTEVEMAATTDVSAVDVTVVEEQTVATAV